MNIFFVDRNPYVAAKSLADKHVIKMILESAQLLSTAHRVLDGQEMITTSKSGRKQKIWTLNDSRNDLLYKATHINHPCSVWTRTTSQNYRWLWEHFAGLLEEYTYRYHKTHACYSLFVPLFEYPHNIKKGDFTDPPLAMPPECKVSKDVVACYRHYYKYNKSHLFSWKNNNKPEWISTNETFQDISSPTF